MLCPLTLLFVNLTSDEFLMYWLLNLYQPGLIGYNEIQIMTIIDKKVIEKKDHLPLKKL